MSNWAARRLRGKLLVQDSNLLHASQRRYTQVVRNWVTPFPLQTLTTFHEVMLGTSLISGTVLKEQSISRTTKYHVSSGHRTVDKFTFSFINAALYLHWDHRTMHTYCTFSLGTLQVHELGLDKRTSSALLAFLRMLTWHSWEYYLGAGHLAISNQRIGCNSTGGRCRGWLMSVVTLQRLMWPITPLARKQMTYK